MTHQLDKKISWTNGISNTEVLWHVGSWFTIWHDDACPIHASALKPASWAGPLLIPRVGQLVGVVLLPWMGHVRVYVAVPSSRMDLLALPVGRPDVYQVTRETGHVGLMQRKWGREYWVTMYLNYLYGLVWSQCFFRRLIQTCMVTGSQPLRTPRAIGPGWT